MDEPYLGEIRTIAIPYAPKGWLFCNGQTLPINQNQALFSLLGTTYGGNGTTTFNLPNLQSRVPVGVGQAPGLSPYTLGQMGGAESVALTQAQLPQHTHPFTGTLKTGGEADEVAVTGNYPATGSLQQYSNGPKNAIMGTNTSVSGTTTNQGSGAPHENRQPFIGMYYVIAVQGLYPSRA
jgi:microcystin-dependent protein